MYLIVVVVVAALWIFCAINVSIFSETGKTKSRGKFMFLLHV